MSVNNDTALAAVGRWFREVMKLSGIGWWMMASCCSTFGSDRSGLDLNPGWKFIQADVPNASLVDCNDVNWVPISTPHTFNDADTFDNFALSGMRGEQNQWSGKTWYRKQFVLPDSAKGQKVYVEFEGVRQIADVYLNGHLLGTSKNGFIPFGFDLTPFANFGSTNVLAVMCDNRFMKSHLKGARISASEIGSSAFVPAKESEVQADQIPWNNPQWQPPHGGIYRDVRLYITDPVAAMNPTGPGMGGHRGEQRNRGCKRGQGCFD